MCKRQIHVASVHSFIRSSAARKRGGEREREGERGREREREIPTVY